ncbi:Os06g0628931 [Oryza sativa Japonica Group]|uniref:Uncharacterized protein n=2 Tax=Oryza sativa subsp. japonica TaxID=39947 RepID=A3BDR4_ORYSJ|nr:hypothetical protein OsJ_22046 [Oryza sativa Japonica Group]BAD37400.1 hypothetical protein [Oryza sativa Japonica Group]BAD37725.1 hypothetical protein [Oryza sativa Japonica Group]BAS98718.1 Os06g0628931 [Oryza sativa Japonica Group]
MVRIRQRPPSPHTVSVGRRCGHRPHGFDGVHPLLCGGGRSGSGKVWRQWIRRWGGATAIASADSMAAALPLHGGSRSDGREARRQPIQQWGGTAPVAHADPTAAALALHSCCGSGGREAQRWRNQQWGGMEVADPSPVTATGDGKPSRP